MEYLVYITLVGGKRHKTNPSDKMTRWRKPHKMIATLLHFLFYHSSNRVWNMWKIFPLIPSKKLLTWGNWDKLIVYFSVFQWYNLAKLVFWSILSFKNWKVDTWFVSVFSGQRFFEGIRGFFSIYSRNQITTSEKRTLR